jgi:concanavalin A-like lectin/glucanase superfamily protein
MRRPSIDRPVIVLMVTVLTTTIAMSSPASARTTYTYAMDETSGTTMTGSGGAPNGVISGDVALGVGGVSGTAYAFNQNVGSCDSSWNVTGTGKVAITSASAFDVGTNAFSYSVWLKTNSVPGADSGVSKNCDFDIWRRASRWRMELIPPSTSNAYGTPLCSWKGVLNGISVHVSLKGTVDVTDGTWHQITCARTSTGEQLIVDGAVEKSSLKNVGSIDTTSKVFVGSQQGNADYYEGRLDDLSFSVG